MQELLYSQLLRTARCLSHVVTSSGSNQCLGAFSETHVLQRSFATAASTAQTSGQSRGGRPTSRTGGMYSKAPQKGSTPLDNLVHQMWKSNSEGQPTQAVKWFEAWVKEGQAEARKENPQYQKGRLPSQYQPTTEAVQQYFDALRRMNVSSDKMAQAMDMVTSIELRITIVGLNTALLACRKEASPEKLLSLYDTYTKLQGIYPNSLTHELVTRATIASGRDEEALRYLEKMTSGDFDMSQRKQVELVCDMAVRRFAERKNFAYAVRVINMMIDLGLDIPVGVYGAVLSAASEADDQINMGLSLHEVCKAKVDVSTRWPNAVKDSKAPRKIEEGLVLKALSSVARQVKKSSGSTEYLMSMAKQIFDTHAEHLKLSNFHPKGFYPPKTTAPPPAPVSLAAPSTSAFQALIACMAHANDWAGVLARIVDLETAHGKSSPQSVSVYGGLRFLPELLDGEKPAKLYNLIQSRKLAKLPVTTTMMNVLLRSLALSGQLDMTGKVFEEYAYMEVQHDTDSYNAVIESCTQTGKVAAIESLLDYMKNQGVQPNADSYDLALKGFIKIEDCDSVMVWIQKMQGADFEPRFQTLYKGLELAKVKRHTLCYQRIGMIPNMTRHADAAALTGVASQV